MTADNAHSVDLAADTVPGMATYETGFCQVCSKVREDTDNDRGLCRSCVWYLYPDTDEGRRCKVELDTEAAE